jgi:hypothetical protein
MLVWAAVSLARPRQGRCPGPRERWYARVVGWACLSPRGCGYDLSGLPLPVRCPECGTVHAGRVAARPVGRRVTAAVLCFAAAAGCWNVRWVRRCEWLRYTPTDVVITLERYTPLPDIGRRVLSDRWEGMSERTRARTARLALHALGSDGKRWNADWGIDILGRMRPEADALLLSVLDDPDYQRRQIAAAMLRSCVVVPGEKPPKYPITPTDRLFAVSVEGLAHDRINGDSAWTNNAFEAFMFLLNFPEQTAPHLRAAIASEDEQQAFLAAALAGFARRMELAEGAVPVLADRLSADDRWGNAVVALPAILGFGERARPILAAIQPRDEQQQALLEIELKLLDGIPLSLRDERALRRVTTSYRDPREAFRDPASLRPNL